MSEPQEPKSVEELCDRIADADDEGDRVSLRAILKVVGRRSFGPLLLVSGLAASAPLVGDIPGVPTATGITVIVIAAQLLIGRDCFWLPEFLLDRSVARETLCKALDWIRPVARFLDRLTRRRMSGLTQGPGIYAIAVVCVAIALMMPAMEVVPFSAQFAGAALTLFGVSMIAHDGLVAVVAFVFTASTFGMVGYSLLA